MTVGLGGTYSATDRGQPMYVHGRTEPFFVFDPSPDSIEIEQIAHVLANQCRFGGHVSTFYSVAQHSCLVASLCPLYPLEGLLHDAAEAYLGDLIRPLKVVLPIYQEAEQRLEQVIAARFGLRYPWPDSVKAADNVALATEKRDLLCPNDGDWGPLPEPLPFNIKPFAPAEAKGFFLEFFRSIR